jgi:hypothetical protein
MVSVRNTSRGAFLSAARTASLMAEEMAALGPELSRTASVVVETRSVRAARALEHARSAVMRTSERCAMMSQQRPLKKSAPPGY